MVNILAAGVYLSSFLKVRPTVYKQNLVAELYQTQDFFCVPRPYTPPVERLSISSHGLEYGFPSTHSTNAVSISLYLAQIYLQSCSAGEEYSLTSSVVLSVCALYAVSVVLGSERFLYHTLIRITDPVFVGLYCGMHSMVGEIAQSSKRVEDSGLLPPVDCLAGTLLGAAIWYSYYRLTPAFMAFLTNRSIGKIGMVNESARTDCLTH